MLFAGQETHSRLLADAIAAAPGSATPLQAVAAALGAVTSTFTEDRREFAARLLAVIARNSELGKTAARAPAACDPAAPRIISHAEMNAAYDSGHAVPTGQGIAWLARYRNAWWIAYERGWLRVTDDIMAADLDQAAAHLTAANAAAVRDISIRSGPGLTPGQDTPAMPAE